LKEQNPLHFENIADLLWLSQFTGMQSVVAENFEDKKQEEPNKNPKIEDDEVEEDENSSELEMEEPQNDLEVHTDNQDDENSSHTKQKKAKAIQSPKKLPLSNYREWEKAFKFINLKQPSRNKYELDEEKTVENIASLKVFDLVFKQVHEKSFFLTIVIDRGETMELWDELIKNFEQMLLTMGVFARVSIYYWDTKDKKPRLYVDRELKREISENLVVMDGKRNLVWVMSDCIAPSWRSSEAFKSIDRWSLKSFTSILQMFPKEMWMGTMLFKGKHIRLSTTSFNPINKKLKIKSSKREKNALKIPVISFDPYALQAWAKVVVNAKNNSISGVELEDVDFTLVKSVSKKEITPDMRMQRFYSQASPIAQKLAFYMSVLPVDFKVTRILQEERLSKSNQAHVAEVFLGGLIERRKKDKSVHYDFYPKIREELNANISADDSFEIMADMSNFVSSHLGIGFDFKALLTNPNEAFEGDVEISSESLAYAKLASRVLKRKGGELYTIAKKIDRKVNEIEIEAFPKNYEEQVIDKLSSMFIEELVNYEIDDESLTYDGGIATISLLEEPENIKLLKIDKIGDDKYNINITFNIESYIEVEDNSTRTFINKEEQYFLFVECTILVEFREEQLLVLEIEAIQEVFIVQEILKEIILYKEDNLDIDIALIVNRLNQICTTFSFRVGKEPFVLVDELVSASTSYDKLDSSLHRESKMSLRSILFSEKAYNNNYFFEPKIDNDDILRIVSFYAWEKLTTLSKNNGAIYFIGWILALISESHSRHYESTGCIYDFSGNKIDIDQNMREPYICQECFEVISQKKSFPNNEMLDDLNSILDFVGKASKHDLDIFAKGHEIEASVVIQLEKNGWNSSNILQEYKLPNGHRADVLLHHQDKDLAIIEIKSSSNEPKAGLKQAINYGKELNIDYVYATNGLEIYEYSLKSEIEKYIDEYPSPKELYQRYNNEPTYWHLQLHPHDSSYTIEQVKDILSKNLIGLDFGKNDGYHENSSLENWYSDTEDRKKYFLKIVKNDIVLIRHGAKPIALVKAISGYKYVESPTPPIWFKHQVEVEVLSYYHEYIKKDLVKPFSMPQTRGTLWKSKNANTDTYQIIDDWYKTIQIKPKQQQEILIRRVKENKLLERINIISFLVTKSEEYELLAQSQDISFIYHFDVPSFRVNIELLLFRDIFDKLVKNSFDFTPPKSFVNLSSRIDSKHFIIEIIDEGVNLERRKGFSTSNLTGLELERSAKSIGLRIDFKNRQDRSGVIASISFPLNEFLFNE